MWEGALLQKVSYIVNNGWGRAQPRVEPQVSPYCTLLLPVKVTETGK
jgi:hypothetical protein